MPNEVAVQEDSSSSIELLPPKQPASVSAQRMLMQHAEMMHTAHELASAMVRTTMVPARFVGKAGDATAAILYGAELGLNPIQSLQQVFAVNGSPAMYARTMVALLKARGYQFKTIEQTDEAVEIHGWEPGRNKAVDEPDEKSRWTIERATKAKYTNNPKYQSDPQAMLYAKSAAEVCRHIAPEILLGISFSVEELVAEQWADSPLQQPARNAPVTVEEILGTAETAPATEEAQAAPETQPENPAQSQPEPEPAEAEVDGDATALAAEAAEANPDAASENCAKPETEQVEASQTETKPEPPREISKMRRALERRLFKLLAEADIQVENREDRLLVYRGILDRPEPINSTNDLGDTEVAAICDQLFTWSKAGELGSKITDILNSATLQAESEKQEQSTNNEGE